MWIVRLPVEGTQVVIRLPAGEDDLRLLEADRTDLRVALALLEGLARRPDGAPLDSAALAIPDVDALLLLLRQKVVGDRVRSDAQCPACSARVDISFSVAEYLEHHAPTGSPDVERAEAAGWYRLAGENVELRPPTAADQLAIAWQDDPEDALVARCVRGALTEALRAWVEAALEVIAPSLCGDLETTCPECGAAVELSFDPLAYTLRELRHRAAGLYDEVAWIAHHYHWSEAEILALPATRRARYAELAAEHARRRRYA